MAKHQSPSHEPDQRTFGFVREHERLRLGRRGRVKAHWRRLPGPQALPRDEARRDDAPHAARIISISVTVSVSVAL